MNSRIMLMWRHIKLHFLCVYEFNCNPFFILHSDAMPLRNFGKQKWFILFILFTFFSFCSESSKRNDTENRKLKAQTINCDVWIQAQPKLRIQFIFSYDIIDDDGAWRRNSMRASVRDGARRREQNVRSRWKRKITKSNEIWHTKLKRISHAWNNNIWCDDTDIERMVIASAGSSSRGDIRVFGERTDWFKEY